MEPNHPPEDTLGDLLTRSAPSLPDLPSDRVGALSAELVHEVVEADRGLRGRVRAIRRRHRVAAGIASAAIVLVPSGAWAAQHFLAQTGRFGNPALNPDFEDRSEFINLCAKDLAGYVTTLAPTDLPAPPGHSWPGYAADVANSYTRTGDCTTTTEATTQQTSLRLDLLARASGDWGCTLVQASETGDRSAITAARTQMVDLDAAARRLSPIEGTVGTQDPDVFLANSKLPQWVGCRR